MKILAMSGSLRAAANTRVVLAAALEAIRQEADANGMTAEIDVYEGSGDLPIFNEEIEEPVPEPVTELRRRIERADALLIVTPEYNASIPGGLKNAVDWASRPAGETVLADKPTATIANSNSPFGGTWAGEHLRRSLTFAGASVIDDELAIGQVLSHFDEDGRPDEEIATKLAETAAKLVAAVPSTLRDRSDLTGSTTKGM